MATADRAMKAHGPNGPLRLGWLRGLRGPSRSFSESGVPGPENHKLGSRHGRSTPTGSTCRRDGDKGLAEESGAVTVFSFAGLDSPERGSGKVSETSRVIIGCGHPRQRLICPVKCHRKSARPGPPHRVAPPHRPGVLPVYVGPQSSIPPGRVCREDDRQERSNVSSLRPGVARFRQGESPPANLARPTLRCDQISSRTGSRRSSRYCGRPLGSGMVAVATSIPSCRYSVANTSW